MFKYIKAVVSDKSIRNKILFVLFILVITRILSIIPIPSLSGADIAQYVADNKFLGLLNIFAGGGIASLSIVMLGVQPYITSSIVMQLLAVLVPSLKKLKEEEGENGRRKFTQWTRLLTIPFAILQGYGLLLFFVKQKYIEAMDLEQMLVNIIIITAGTILMMWLGEKINEHGVGNGVSLIILGGIVASLPSQIQSLFTTGAIMTHLSLYIALLIIFVIVLFAIVGITEAERPLTVTYSKQSRGYASDKTSQSYIPIRLTTAGVIPIIFAVSLLSVPSILQGLISGGQSSGILLVIVNYIANVFNNPTLYTIIYFSLVFIFTFFYTFVMFDPVRTSDQIQKGGAFIPGVRPGENTIDHISTILIRVTLIGAVFLGVVAVLPIIISNLTGLAVTVGGTSLLITVSVVIDLVKKIDAQMTMSEYNI